MLHQITHQYRGQKDLVWVWFGSGVLISIFLSTYPEGTKENILFCYSCASQKSLSLVPAASPKQSIESPTQLNQVNKVNEDK